MSDDSRGAKRSTKNRRGRERPREILSQHRLLDIQVYVVNNKRGLQAHVLMAVEPDSYRLSDERVHAERMLLVASRVIQVRERSQSSQHTCTSGVQHLDLQGIEGRGGGGLSGINVQPEGQSRRCGPCRDRDRLGGGIRMCRSVAILPGVPASAVRRLSRGIVDNSGSQRPGSRRCTVLKSRIANQLLRRGRADGQGNGG